MGKKLGFSEVKKIALRMGLDPCALWAVCQVESNGDGFLPDGRAKILFEGHIFWRELKKRGIDPAPIAMGCPSILYQSWTKAHYKGGAAEYARLEAAMAVHPDAALSSTSFGMFQIMGFNHKLCGYGSVVDFAAAMQKNAALQLDAVCSFISRSGMLPSLKALDWKSFARRYNGAGYAQNKYDIKLEQAYSRCKGEKA